MIHGIGASEGYAIGKIYLWKKEEIVISEEKTSNVEEELNLFEACAKTAKEQLEELFQHTKETIGEEEAMVFDCHLMMLEDPDLTELIQNNITQEGMQAPMAIKSAADFYVNIFENMEDEYMKARAADVLDIAGRMIRIILKTEDSLSGLPDNAVIVAHDLTPSDTARIDKTKVKAFITEVGSRTSHSAIMARSMRIPAVLGVGGILEELEGYIRTNGEKHPACIIDGFTGQIYLDPEQELISTYEDKIISYQKDLEALVKFKEVQLSYTSGRKIKVAGNIGSVEDLNQLCENGAQGIGLFRTEFLFMGRDQMPGEEEQIAAYKAAAERMNGEAVVIRTLDIGGDKKLPYLDIPQEENPFLGLRAIRLCFKEKQMFKTQLRAILQAGVYGNLHIMFPMISALHEIKQAKEILEECKTELRQEGINFKEDIPVGIMIEIPAAAVQASEFAKEVDFFSIGTNDLVQYTLAVDRMNPEVSGLYNPYHPAVLSLIEMTIKAAHEHGIWCGMCGEMASEVIASKYLAAFELDEFSVSGSSVLRVKESLSQQPNVKQD